MSTFSDVIMRSHPSNLPDADYQIWDSEETVLFMKKFTEIHMGLKDYKMSLMQEANTQGTPVTRPLLLHWPENEFARSIDSQFMLGENIMMAPAFLANITEVAMYLPGPENWLNLWTKEWTNITASGQ